MKYWSVEVVEVVWKKVVVMVQNCKVENCTRILYKKIVQEEEEEKF